MMRSTNSSMYSFVVCFLLASTFIHSSVAVAAATAQVVVGGGAGQVIVHPKTDVNYMSNRRVPKGPDPIHNRRASNSRRPPGNA